MPIYAFTTRNGETVERFFSMADKPTFVKLSDGRRADYDPKATHQPTRARHGELWPRWSDAAGINPEQRAESEAADRRLGVSAEYNELGQVKFESRSHERHYCEAHGLYQRNSYGGKNHADRDRANDNVTRQLEDHDHAHRHQE